MHLWRRLRPRRTIWPTRDGWWCLFSAMGLGVAAINTGNNLLYLLSSMLLGLVVVSGVLSEAVMRGLRLTAILPEEFHAGRPALVGATVANRKRRIPSYSISIEALGRGGPGRVVYLPRLPAGDERVVTWEVTLATRGRHRLPGVRVTTLFPFGVFLKAGQVILQAEVLVYPALAPVPAHLLRRIGGSGPAQTRRRGRGSDLHNLRDYRPGDDPRLIHWRSSAKTQALTVRELEAETSTDTRIVLDGTGAGDPARLEAGLSEAASLACHLLRAGAMVELTGPGLLVPLARGRGQERRILTALALYEPRPLGAGPGLASVAAREGAMLREIRIGIG
ncbi:MAG: hypothetical protein A2X52_10375 [Candidatus Rokubacteria bacterium GWC2_70_16]|nr:MAG: hypothetical protein A2X52_10375 [Candidatus Rokubacteria bacterium GWC2_70_16]